MKKNWVVHINVTSAVKDGILPDEYISFLCKDAEWEANRKGVRRVGDFKTSCSTEVIGMPYLDEETGEKKYMPLQTFLRIEFPAVP